MGEGGRRPVEGAIELTTLCTGVAWSYHDVLVFLLHRSSAHIRNGQSTWLEACGEPATPWGPDWRSEMLTTNLGRKGETVNELSNGVVEWQLASGFPHLFHNGDGASAHGRHNTLVILCALDGILN